MRLHSKSASYSLDDGLPLFLGETQSTYWCQRSESSFSVLTFYKSALATLRLYVLWLGEKEHCIFRILPGEKKKCRT